MHIVETPDRVIIYADRDRRLRRLNLESGMIVAGLSISYAPLGQAGIDVGLVLVAVCLVGALAIISHVQKRSEIMSQRTPIITLTPQGMQVACGRMARIRWSGIRAVRPRAGLFHGIEILPSDMSAAARAAGVATEDPAWADAASFVLRGKPLVIGESDLPISPDALVRLIENYAAGPYGPGASDAAVWPPRPRATPDAEPSSPDIAAEPLEKHA